MPDPAGAVRAFQRDGRAAVGGAMQQVATTIPKQHVFDRHAQAVGQPFKFFP
ncbi:hypothetical protein D3C77_652840 [compost metagenome]